MHGTASPIPINWFELADLEWQAAVDLGPAHKLSEDDREYQRNCFDRAAAYAARAAATVEA